MLTLFVVVSILGICSTLPSEIPQNVIIAPPNCTEGQEWVNGACRDIWNSAVAAAAPLKIPSDIDVQNMITVPPNCPPGQQWINGQCRDVWRGGALAYLNHWAKTIIIEDKALQTQTANVLTAKIDSEIVKVPLRIINIPNQCPIGYRHDALGICRRVL
ncbi:uncharacterized protein LOC123879475 isoform X3 [Maniola jurtina]|uniref:uncharacterized protein LOC123879475 isoform X2 n=1 Tax=Maniola jurtina TaxID=191418 RepID=UPI001E68789B|nr:uncharacterized protein LOC123879475 isoform X2 [Maniola jurtina]XP_045783171.1 uncharacterized protein LOC123879475 isoform X3 [Maniola jurtina]